MINQQQREVESKREREVRVRNKRGWTTGREKGQLMVDGGYFSVEK